MNPELPPDHHTQLLFSQFQHGPAAPHARPDDGVVHDLRMTSPSEVLLNGGNVEEGNGEEALVLGRDQGTSEPSQSSFGRLFFLFWFLFSISQ